MGILCYSLKDVGAAYCHFLAQTRAGSAVEIRLDSCRLDEKQIREVFSSPRLAKLVATCHAELPSQVEEASEKLTAAILAGADYVDIPLDFPESTRNWLIGLALNKGCRTILSYHNYSFTDTLDKLVETARSAFYQGADIVKIATTARKPEDCDRVLKLYDHFEPEKLIAFAMGPLGYDSRLSSFAAGAPLFYLSPTRNGETAPGQPHCFDFYDEERILLRGEPSIPASKSFSQRAILLAALTTGTTKLYNLTPCKDTEAALMVARQLMAEVSIEGTTCTITGHQDLRHKPLKIKDNFLFVGESGLMARLCIPLAGLARGEVTIDGTGTLLTRKLDDQKPALRALGLKVKYTYRSYLPVTVSGRLHGGAAQVDGSRGSQMVSGLLLALSQTEPESMIKIFDVTSEPYIELTTYIASFFGLSGYECPELDRFYNSGEEDYDDEGFDDGCADDTDRSDLLSDEEPLEAGIRSYIIHPSQEIRPVEGLEIEKDWSAAAMFLVAGAIMGDITIRGMDMNSLQSDAVILDLLQDCHIDITEPSPGVVNVRKSMICPFYFDITDAPDLFAPLFVLATRAEGETVIAGIDRLSNKESDRARTFAEEFGKLGVRTRFGNNEIYIYGHEAKPLRSARCRSHGDHRLAMALAIADLFTKGGVKIDDVECISKSYPGFLENLEKLKNH